MFLLFCMHPATTLSGPPVQLLINTTIWPANHMTTLWWTNKNRATRWESGVAGRAHVDGENMHELQEERLWVGTKPTYLHCTQSTFVLKKRKKTEKKNCSQYFPGFRRCRHIGSEWLLKELILTTETQIVSTKSNSSRCGDMFGGGATSSPRRLRTNGCFPSRLKRGLYARL